MSRFLVRRCCFVWLGLLVAVPGCGADGRQAVSGTVRFRGQPLAIGNIEFSPEDNQPTLEAAAVRNGEFAIPKAKGLLPGRYKVRINAPDVTGRPEPRRTTTPSTTATRRARRSLTTACCSAGRRSPTAASPSA
jgi:hypothetical protein